MDHYKNLPYYSKIAEYSDLPQLLELEKVWPEKARATYEQLKYRIDTFAEGYIVAVDKTGVIASIICHPYVYNPDDLSLYPNWKSVVAKCYEYKPEETNALYIIAGTCKPGPYAGRVFDFGIELVVALAKKMGKRYVVGGCLLPGYARYKEKHGDIPAADYVFTKSNNRWIDPLIEKYRHHGFSVPSKEHVVENYYGDMASCNYSALVICEL